MLRRFLARTLVSSAAAFRLPPAARTLGDALRSATATFEASSIPEPLLSAEHLLTRCAGFGSSRSALSAHADEALDLSTATAFEAMCARRLEREPVQYILGDWDFHDLTLEVQAPVLIPRPETEELVEHVLDAHAEAGNVTYLDVGCGSGAIGLALLRRMPSARCVGIDTNPVATTLAARNADRCGVGDRFEAVLVDGGVRACQLGPRFDVLVSNPPYIPRVDMRALEPEVAWHEDEAALCGGEDGLDVIREVLSAAPRLLRPEGPRRIWLETDTSHPPLIERWIASHPSLGLELIRSMRDAFGRPRFCELSWDGR